jgi:lipopolysaccharide transport system permease protein
MTTHALAKKTIIKPGQTGSINLKELWHYRELFYFFAWRDIKVRYKQTALGAGWAILQPFLATGVFTMFFNRVAGISSGSATIPYPVFAYLGLMFWNVFSIGLGAVSNSIVGSTGVITKIYFPRLIPPLAAMALSIVDFFFAGVAFIAILAVYKVVPHPMSLLILLPSLFLIVFGALGVGLYFAALNVKYRDVRSALPFITQLLLFVTPVIYPISLIPERFRIYAYLNPATGSISSIRSAFFGQPINWAGFGLSFIGAGVAMVIGLWYFKKTERNFVDII